MSVKYELSLVAGTSCTGIIYCSAGHGDAAVCIERSNDEIAQRTKRD